MARVLIPIGAFLEFVRSLEGEVIPTRAGGSAFTVRVLEKKLEFTPTSSGTPRGHTFRYVQKVLDQFQETGSWTTTDYRFTVNASYQLTLIDRYLAHL